MRVIKTIIGIFIFCVIFFGACDGTSCINNCTYSCQKSCDDRKQEKENQKQLENNVINFDIVDTLNESNKYTLKGILSLWNGISSNIKYSYYLPSMKATDIEDKLEFGGVFNNKDGYIFLGIYDTKDTSGTKIINSKCELATDIGAYCGNNGNKKNYTFYSVWEPVKLNIQFEIDASKTNDLSLNILRIENINYGTKISETHAKLVEGLPALTPSNNDYNFVGWQTSTGEIVPAGDANLLLDKEVVLLENNTATELTITFKAVFEKGKGTVVFHYGEDYNKTYTITAEVGNTFPWNLVESTHEIKRIVDFMHWTASPTNKTEWGGRVEKNQTLHLYAVTEELKIIYLKFNDNSSAVQVKVYESKAEVKTASGNNKIAIDTYNGKEIYAWYPTSGLNPGEQVTTNNGTSDIRFDYSKLEEGKTYYAKYLG